LTASNPCSVALPAWSLCSAVAAATLAFVAVPAFAAPAAAVPAPAAAAGPQVAPSAAEVPLADPLTDGLTEEIRTVLGRVVEVRVKHGDAAAAKAAVTAAQDEIARVLRKLDHKQRDSEFYSINQAADKEEVLVSEETALVVQRMLDFCRRSGGAYDPMVASWDYLWDFGRKPFVRPLPAEIAARKPIANCKHLLIKPSRAVRIMQLGGRITAQGIVAGSALQKAAELLRAKGITDFRIRVGNDSYVQGRIGTQFWYQPVAHPRKAGVGVGLMYLTSHAAATRTDSETTVHKAGNRYHDVLDPRTGMPVTGVVQATVFASDPQLADAWSTALFVLGPKAGLQILQQLPNVEGFVIDSTGKVWTSPGAEAFVRLPARIDL
jgi:thiamine biosynthesis lipoprotein